METTPTSRLRDRKQNINYSLSTRHNSPRSAKNVPNITSTTSVNAANAINLHLKEYSKTSTTPSRQRRVREWTNEESPTLIETPNHIMEESAPGSLFSRAFHNVATPILNTPSKLKDALAYVISPFTPRRAFGMSQLRDGKPHGTDETEFAFDFRGDVLSGSHMPEFFGENEIIQEPGWVFYALEWISGLFIFQNILFPIISMSISSILFLFWAVFALCKTIYEKLVVKALFYSAKKLVKVVNRLAKNSMIKILALLDTIPSQTRGIILMSLSIVLSLVFIGYALLPFCKQLWIELSNVSLRQSLMDSSLWLQSFSTIIYTRLPNIPDWTRTIKLQDSQFTTNSATSKDISKRLTSLEDSLKNFINSYTKSKSQQESDLTKKWNEVLQKVEKSAKSISFVEKNILEDSKEISQIQKTLKTLQESLKTVSKDKKQVDSLLEQLESQVKSLSTQVNTLQAHLKPKELETIVVQVLDKHIPDKLAAKLDKGKVILTPEFWKLLKSSFAPLSKGSSSSTTTDKSTENEDIKAYLESQLATLLTRKEWKQIHQDFLKTNQALVSEISKSSLNQLVESRILVSKSQVLDIIKEQISALSSKDSILSKNILELFSDKIQATLLDLESIKDSKTLKPDYALSTAGAKILYNLTSETYSVPYKSWLLKSASALFGVKRINPKGPKTAIETSVYPGDCWAMKGNNGTLGILLSKRIVPTEFVIEHSHVSELFSISSAPKSIQVYGIIDKQARLLGQHVFDPKVDRIQNFGLAGEKEKIDSLKVKILSNWGHEEYTCLYRIRVYGQE